MAGKVGLEPTDSASKVRRFYLRNYLPNIVAQTRIELVPHGYEPCEVPLLHRAMLYTEPCHCVRGHPVPESLHATLFTDAHQHIVALRHYIGGADAFPYELLIRHMIMRARLLFTRKYGLNSAFIFAVLVTLVTILGASA